ncbi:MAG TPA: hypothetical protein VIJ75_05100 [Hanamia sp.]
MNNIEKYLQELLNSQDLTTDQENTLQAHKKEVTDFLRVEFGNDPVIRYAGSHEKGTMIQDNFDLDIVCYFPSSDSRSLKDIREDVANHLRTKYATQSKASAERIMNLKDDKTPQGYHIDVVPGRFIENTKDVFLHVAYGDKERMQTNLKTHIDHIANSGCVPVIRLVKIWSNRNNVNIKTFVLELFIVKILNGSQNKDNLKTSFVKIIEALKDRFESIQLDDPANTNNIVSRLVSTSDKAMVVQAAKDAFAKIENTDRVDEWKKVFCEQPEKSYLSNNPQPFIPSRPWCI